jgi:hypothetical protein
MVNVAFKRVSQLFGWLGSSDDKAGIELNPYFETTFGIISGFGKPSIRSLV